MRRCRHGIRLRQLKTKTSYGKVIQACALDWAIWAQKNSGGQFVTIKYEKIKTFIIRVTVHACIHNAVSQENCWIASRTLNIFKIRIIKMLDNVKMLNGCSLPKIKSEFQKANIQLGILVITFGKVLRKWIKEESQRCDQLLRQTSSKHRFLIYGIQFGSWNSQMPPNPIYFR